MVRCSIYYDNTLKEQVFFVRGDERYARSTKVILAEGSRTIEETYFDLNVTVDVLRDVGESSIVIYDNDEVVYIIDDWKSTDTARTIKLSHLVYDVDHNLTAKYIGNKSCSPSLSNTLTINVPDLNIVKSTLTVTSETQVNPNSTQTITATLTNDDNIAVYNADQPINIYYDNTLITTLTTNDYGKINYELPNGSIGLHELYVVFEGSRNLKTSSVTKQISVGYQITNISHEAVFLKAYATKFKATVKDWFENVISSGVLYLEGLMSGSSTWSELANKTVTGSSMELQTSPSSEGTYRLKYEDTTNNQIYYSDEYTPKFVNPSRPTITVNPSPFAKNQQSLITIQTNSSYANARVHCTGSIIEKVYGKSADLYTDASGKVTIPFTGLGDGTKDILVEFGGIYASLNVMDYIQYWTLNNTINQNCTLDSSSLLKYNNFWRISTDTIQFAFNEILSDIDYTVEISGVNSSVPIFITLFEDWSQNPHWLVLDGVLNVESKNGRREIRNYTYNRLTNAKITIIRRSGTVTLTVANGSGSTYYSISIPNQNNELPAIGWLFDRSGGTLDFTEVKIWRNRGIGLD